MPTRVIAGCCARAVSGHAAAVPPMSVMNSRRLTDLPRADVRTLAHHEVGCAPQQNLLSIGGFGHLQPRRLRAAATGLGALAAARAH